MARFKETARTYLSKLPEGLDENDENAKVACVTSLMAMEPDEAASYLASLKTVK